MTYKQNYRYLNYMSVIVEHLSKHFGIATNYGVPMWRKMFCEQKETFYTLYNSLSGYHSLQNKYLYPDTSYWDGRRKELETSVNEILAPYNVLFRGAGSY